MEVTKFDKWENLYTTAKGEERGHVPFESLKTLWFNTGTQCNLECKNCYIESSPKNDRLQYLELADVSPFLEEIKEHGHKLDNFGFTGGEPFLNPSIIQILDETLKLKVPVLVLTNALRVLKRWEKQILDLHTCYGDLLRLRVSLDHYTKDLHEKERGPKSFNGALKGLKWLHENGIKVSIAGRSLKTESSEQVKNGYQALLNDFDIDLILDDSNLVIFPEMDPKGEVPEITIHCWGILNKSPNDQMCAHERMVVRKKGSKQADAQACTLLAYDETFNMGSTIKEASKSVHLNHRFCAEFCVLGGASCSST